jgi:hypothetical protein
MGITYENKPDFIERLIEVGSQQFFLSLANLSQAAAEAEIGEHIGVSQKAVANAADALWYLRKTLELYVGLANSLEGRPINEKARQILKAYDFANLKRQIGARSTILSEDSQWAKFVASAQKVDPLGTIKDFIAEVKAIEPKLVALVGELSGGEMNPRTIHECLAAFIQALVFGQYIAEFNRDTRERFA